MRQVSGTVLLAGLALLGLASCQVAVPDPALAPSPRPRMSAPDNPPPPGPASAEIARHFAQVQADLLSRGLLRTDGGGKDAPFSQRAVVDNFIRIALYDEYVSESGKLVARQTESRLRRWETPIRMGLVFGPSIPAAQQARDRVAVTAYARRLSRLTGHPIQITAPENANFHVLILNEDERRDFAPELQRLVPGIAPSAARMITDVPRSTFCLVLAFSKGESASYSRAVALIRGEHPDRMRRSCIHEELAQGMGLANDSPLARPSIFNDDEEFSLLTPHDELLLQILYDRRLSPGMTPAAARPIVETIAAELMGGES
ncbi:DUF2927 family protein [Rhodovulum bhavnagarense]|uniref:DUF2927 family protein n=1 Tax=Rhodovulum bhavnagarense TaxID=992286 RepID=A0A4V2SW44_9RHOB|nr:DUF2927 domain-containing protein [Rhodovulum bhavnagarense]TCP60856.1 DUF2927 family protein [Rhodovulum bhavnagarense]